MFVDIETIPTLHSFEVFEEDYNLYLKKGLISKKGITFIIMKLNKLFDILSYHLSGFNSEMYEFQNP